MLKISKVEIEHKIFEKLYVKLTNSIKAINPNLKPQEYSTQLFDTLKNVFGSSYVIIQSNDIYYSVQMEPFSLVIMTVNNIRIIAYKPRIQIKPVKKGYTLPNDETVKVFISDNKAPNIEEFSLIKNTMFNDKDLKDVKNLIGVYLNKNKEQENYLYQFLPEIKQFVTSKAGTGVYHLFLTDSKYSHLQVPEDRNPYIDERMLQIELKLVKDKRKYMLYIFESKGYLDGFLARCLNRWKDFLTYLFMFFIVSIISVCRDESNRLKGSDVDFVCRNQFPLIFVLAIGVIWLVITKNQKAKAKLQKFQNKHK